MQTGRRVVDPVVLVPKPTADDDTRKSVVRLLRHALDEAEAGNIITVIIIAENVSEEWMNWASETISLSKTIGRLEITKVELVERFLKKEASE